MRLIDADIENERLLDFIAQNDTGIQYAIEHKDMTMLEDIFFDYFNEQKTAFDLESVIEKFESDLEGAKLQLEVLNIHADRDSLSVKNDILFFRERAERYEEFLEILKSAANMKGEE